MVPLLVLIDVGLNNPLKPSIATRTFNLWARTQEDNTTTTEPEAIYPYLFSVLSISSSNTEVISVANLDLTRPCNKSV